MGTLNIQRSASHFCRDTCTKCPAVRRLFAVSNAAGKPVDFARAFWTPPLSPVAALCLERKQIEAIGMQPLVSLTDHDNVDAPMSLHVTTDPAEVPVSVEWTMPFERSILHLGIHKKTAKFCPNNRSTSDNSRTSKTYFRNNVVFARP